MMGTTQISLCVFLGCVIAVQSVLYHNGRFTQDVVGVYENRVPFSFGRNFDFTPQGPIFSSWQSWTPDFHRLAGLSPFLNVPRVQVYCDASTLTVLVDKSVSGLKLTGEEIQLGNGCFSNGELANEFVFTYGFAECGTTPMVEDDLEVFTNTLFLNLRRISPTWWETPSAVHVFCVAKRLNKVPKFSDTALPENDDISIKAMSSSWTSAAESNIYKRGQLVNLQVLAKTRINQEAFIQSCFVSVFPEPRAKPRQTVIFNKGCVTPLGSSTTRVTFVASNSADAVNFVLNTSYLISELYIHCSVLISGQGVTPGSKSCNYNVIESRWEELSGDLEACECCSSRCKAKNLPGDAKAVVSTGPFVIVDEDGERTLPSIAEEESANVPNSMQSALPDLADVIVSSVPRSKFNAGPEGVVAVSQDPATRLTLWLPEQVPPQSDSNDITKLHSSITNQEPHPNPTNEIKGQSFSSVSPSTMNLPTMVNGWKSPPHPAVPEDFKRKSRSGRSGNFDSKEEPVNFSLPAEISVKYLMLVERPNSAELDNAAAVEESQSEKWLQNEIKDPNHDDLPQMLTDGAMMPEGTVEIPPITRSKLSFSKAADGSQTLSYEEEAVVHKTSPVERKQLKLKGLHSTFLNLLRRMKNAE
ncbi:zona pellucida protein C [Haplochromis burtoni]|uniref:zona pellucida protein C n=1 Tax=Haplochromis burtoni TaxID=8153 RepID=UPI0003BD7473|nr:zona pellucida protein C [Haplochromis burtoni]